MRLTALFAALLALALAGCSSFETRVERGRDPGAYRRFFVQSNLDDNHAVDAMFVRALQAHGRQAELGPLTMLPASTEAIVTFQDRWTWDFKTHLVALRVVVLDARTRKPVAGSAFTGPIALTTEPQEIVDRLVQDLLAPRTAAAARQ